MRVLFFIFFLFFSPFLEKNSLFESRTIVVVGVVKNVCFKFVIDIIVLISKRSHYLLMRVFFELHKSSVQEIEFYGEFCDVIDPIPKTLAREVIGY